MQNLMYPKKIHDQFLFHLINLEFVLQKVHDFLKSIMNSNAGAVPSKDMQTINDFVHNL